MNIKMKLKEGRSYISEYGAKSIYVKTIIALCTIIVAIISLIGIISYINSTSILSNKVYMLERINLEQIINNVDYVVEKADVVSLNMVNDSYLVRDISQLNVEETLYLKNHFFSKYIIDDTIDSIYIYYSQSNKIYSTKDGIHYANTFYDVDWIFEYNRLKPLNLKRHLIYNIYKTIEGAEKTDCITIMRGFSPLNREEFGSVVVNIDKKKLFDGISGIGSFVVLNEDDEYLYGDKNILDKISNSSGYKKILENNNEMLKLEGTDFFGMCVKSQNTGWSFLRIYESKYLNKERDNIKYMTLILVFLCAAIGVLFSGKIINSIYNPIVFMLNKTNQIAEERPAKNEIERLSYVMESILNERGEQFSLKGRSFILQGALLKLCYGSIMSEEETEILKQLEYCGSMTKRKKYAAIVVEILDKSERKIHYNDIRKIYDKSYDMVVTYVGDDKIAGLVGFDDDDIVYTVAKRVVDTLNNENNIHCIIGIGSNVEGLAQFQLSFREATEALLYREIKSTETIYHISQFENGGDVPKYYYPVTKEDSLVTEIKLGNAEAAIEIIKEIYNEMLKSRMPTAYLSSMLWLVMGSIVRVTGSMGIAYENAVGKTYYDDFIEFNLLNEAEAMYDFLIKKAILVINYINEKRSYSNESVVKNIKSYIDEHYKEELSLNIFSDMTKFAPTYISAMFKKVEGEGIREYIKTVRMKKAAELLVTTDKSINYIAIEIGYENARSFQRLFKSYFGTSPSEYRKSKCT